MCADDSHFAFLKRYVIEQRPYLRLLAQNAKILRRGTRSACRGYATFSLLLRKILPRLVCGTRHLPPMCRRRLEKEMRKMTNLIHLKRSPVSLRLGHLRGKTISGCFLTLSGRFATQQGRLYLACLNRYKV